MVEVSAHCKSSMNKVSGCSLAANAVTKAVSVSRKRFCASATGKSASSGCLPISNSNSGITSIINFPLPVNFSVSHCAHSATDVSGSESTCNVN